MSAGSRASSDRRRPRTTYERELRVAGPPQFDLLLLGIGPDGHTASLFPDQPSLSERSRLVVGVEQAGLEPFVPRVTLDAPGARVRATGGLPDLRGLEGRRGRGRFRPGCEARSRTCRPRCWFRWRRRSRCCSTRRRRRGCEPGHRGRPRGDQGRGSPRLRERELGESGVEPTDLAGSEALIDQLVSDGRGASGAEPLDGVGIGVPSVVEFGDRKGACPRRTFRSPTCRCAAC